MNRTALSMIFGALVFSASAVQAATEVFLCAGEFDKTMPDGVVVKMWGFARVVDATAYADCGTVTAPYTSPGPEIIVGATEAAPGGLNPLNIHVLNNLPVNFSLVIPGQNDTTMSPVSTVDTLGRSRITSFTHETAPLAVGTYTYNSVATGTYAYHGGSNVNKQVQMGLFGALTKNATEATPIPFPTVAAEAYAGIPYDRAVTLFYSEVDPAVHANVAVDANAAVTVDYVPHYFLINGEDNLDTALVAGTVGQRTLLRFINMGLRTHSPTLMGLRMNVVAEDGKAYSYAKDQYSVTLSAGATIDAIVTPSTSGNFAIFDRMLNLTNHFYAGGTPITPLAENPGGLVGFLAVAPAAVDTDGDGITDDVDNCTLVANADQRDTNGDGFGNVCDGDLNNDGIVNFVDFGLFRTAMASQNPDADFNGDTFVNFADYGIFRTLLGKAPGPAGTL